MEPFRLCEEISGLCCIFSRRGLYSQNEAALKGLLFDVDFEVENEDSKSDNVVGAVLVAGTGSAR